MTLLYIKECCFSETVAANEKEEKEVIETVDDDSKSSESGDVKLKNGNKEEEDGKEKNGDKPSGTVIFVVNTLEKNTCRPDRCANRKKCRFRPSTRHIIFPCAENGSAFITNDAIPQIVLYC